ncbi:Alpha-pyrone synthesis polyketide synthase-like Pks18 [Chlamydia abortus]|nr:Alpha-pyrone synthesis polyketide synthase-like Pks18 [Chlamydia abortus]
MKSNGPDIAILGIGTAVPPYRLEQEEASSKLTDALVESGHRQAARWAGKIFRNCGVETRYTCEPELLNRGDRCRYVAYSRPQEVPSTEERMEKFRIEAARLGFEAGSLALKDSRISPGDITHLITVSCTGLFLPGLDAVLVQQLGLPADVERIPLTFLGCAAGMTALRLSRRMVEHLPQAKVLIVCVELCTLHIQHAADREALFGAAFFGDGASACVVGGAHSSERGMLALGRSRTVLFPESADEMIWKVGNYGFNLYLSPRIPQRIGEYVPPEVERLLEGGPAPEFWAIHPGGRGIIDTLQTIYGLSEEQTAASRKILRRYGNLSSATILFVLEAIRCSMETAETARKEGIALAFGPGLTAEIMQMAYVPPASRG